MSELLKGKTAIITGGNRGIGREIAATFAENGANLILIARNPETLLSTSKELREKYGVQVDTISVDIGNYSELKPHFRSILKISKSIDILVNNAGILQDGIVGMISDNDIHNVFNTNCFGLIHMMQFTARLMKRKKSGSIINISSIIGTNGNKGQIVYGASKAAVIGATLSAAKELAQDNIRVNSIAPGFIKTDMIDSLTDDVFHERINSIAMNRIGSPKDVANCALFLASDLSSYVTGQTIGVDGGMLI